MRVIPSSIPSPARKIGTTSGFGRTVEKPVVGATGVSMSNGSGRECRGGLVGEKGDQFIDQSAKCSGPVSFVPQDREFVAHERRIEA